LRQIFDRVQWDNSRHELQLCKQITRYNAPAIC
jgi:hypothetical protein